MLNTISTQQLDILTDVMRQQKMRFDEAAAKGTADLHQHIVDICKTSDAITNAISAMRGQLMTMMDAGGQQKPKPVPEAPYKVATLGDWIQITEEAHDTFGMYKPGDVIHVRNVTTDGMVVIVDKFSPGKFNVIMPNEYITLGKTKPISK